MAQSATPPTTRDDPTIVCKGDLIASPSARLVRMEKTSASPLQIGTAKEISELPKV